jgi:ATP-dependent Clp protease adapter protein ClpS
VAKLIFAMGSLPGVLDRPETEHRDTNEGQGNGWIVTVFDNPTNTIDEVIHILIVATHCTVDEAAIETWEVHNLGKSVVHHSDKQECEQVAAVIAQIGIEVRVSEE